MRGVWLSQRNVLNVPGPYELGPESCDGSCIRHDLCSKQNVCTKITKKGNQTQVE